MIGLTDFDHVTPVEWNIFGAVTLVDNRAEVNGSLLPLIRVGPGLAEAHGGKVGEAGLSFMDTSPRPERVSIAPCKIGRAHVELQSPDHLVCRLLLEKKNKLKPRRLQPCNSR